ncbi:hypothetical protein KC322_g4057, partial [Hortaea werneckii]
MTVFHWDGTGRNGMAYQLQTSAGIWAPGPGRLKHQSTLEADALYNRVLLIAQTRRSRLAGMQAPSALYADAM